MHHRQKVACILNFSCAATVTMQNCKSVPKTWHWTMTNRTWTKSRDLSIQSCRYTTLALVAMGGRLMLIHILTLMMMFMIILMTFNSLDRMEGGWCCSWYTYWYRCWHWSLRWWPSTVWMGWKRLCWERLLFYHCCRIGLGAIWAIMTLQISTTQTVSLSIFHPIHISLIFVLHIWYDQ